MPLPQRGVHVFCASVVFFVGQKLPHCFACFTCKVREKHFYALFLARLRMPHVVLKNPSAIPDSRVNSESLQRFRAPWSWLPQVSEERKTLEVKDQQIKGGNLGPETYTKTVTASVSLDGEHYWKASKRSGYEIVASNFTAWVPPF